VVLVSRRLQVLLLFALQMQTAVAPAGVLFSVRAQLVVVIQDLL